ncbi:MAG: UDP-N-acetylmuramate dehydrogenase [Alphaproteobacteria bacterium]
MVDFLESIRPHIRGKIVAQAPLAAQSWFRVGGAAEWLFRPADLEDLALFLRLCPQSIAITCIGAASNLLIRDGGVEGVVIRLPAAFGNVTVKDTTIIAGAAALDTTVAQTALQYHITGFEWMIGVPGTIGGAIAMNAGAYGADMSQLVQKVQAVTRNGDVIWLEKTDTTFSYRHCHWPNDLIFVAAEMKGHIGDASAIANSMQHIRQQREETQPVKSRTGGSTFANPTIAESGGKKAWELIDAVGCRGLAIGDASISTKHCNFMINNGNATAENLEKLGETVRLKILEETGVHLHWEIKRLGKRAES